MPTDTVYSVLYIEDNEANRQLVEMVLARRSDLQVRCSTDGLSGLKAIEEAKPDILLLDLTLPDMDGYTVLSLIKTNPKTADLPVIVISGDYPQKPPAGLGLKPDHFLPKPVQVAPLYEAIDRLLGLEGN